MVSLRSQVFDLYDHNNEITHSSLCDMFVKAKSDVLSVYLSEAKSPMRKIKDKPIKKINLDQIESRIIAIVNKSPNAQNMKLALDFIRLKQSTEGLQDDIDIEQYLKKVEAITSCQVEVDNG